VKGSFTSFCNFLACGHRNATFSSFDGKLFEPAIAQLIIKGRGSGLGLHAYA